LFFEKGSKGLLILPDKNEDSNDLLCKKKTPQKANPTVLVPSTREGWAFTGKPWSIGFQINLLRHGFGPDGGLGFT
jgi:hypothetical protein